MDLTQLRRVMREAGVRSLYAKRLSANDNSKNQVYLGPDFSVLNLLPLGAVLRDVDNPQILKASLAMRWITDDGRLADAPNAQVIFYPQYPEVRLSGFLRGCRDAPAGLMRARRSGRVLMLGVTDAGGVIAHVSPPESEVAREFEGLPAPTAVGVFTEVPMAPRDPRVVLVSALREVVREGWITSQRLDSTGRKLDCTSSNCGGLTLEAKLGIRPNGISEPDFHGWELKSHSVTDLNRPHSGGAITLMTPEPTGGYYRTGGPEAFIRRYGYRDPVRRDRLNFSGRHLVGVASARSRLTLTLDGFDSVRRRITDTSSGIALLTRSGSVAALWKYSDLMTHWNRKHAFAAYVPSLHRTSPRNQYRYGRSVRLGEGTDFLLLLQAFAMGRVYYDPGLKVELASSAKPQVKRRSQFRMASRDIGTIYRVLSTVDVLK